MGNFGKYAIVDAITYQFHQEPDWWWKIAPPTSGDELAISKFMLTDRIKIDRDGSRTERPPSHTEVAHREIALTFAGTNIPASEKPVEKGGLPIIREDASVEEIEAILRQMPQPMIMEIWFAISDAVPGWGPALPKAPEQPTA